MDARQLAVFKPGRVERSFCQDTVVKLAVAENAIGKTKKRKILLGEVAMGKTAVVKFTFYKRCQGKVLTLKILGIEII